MIELMSKEIAQYSKRINQQEDINEDFLLDINQLQDNTMTVRENIVDKQRLISNMMKSDKYPSELEPRFNVLLQDISSLINHSNFSFPAAHAADSCGELLWNERGASSVGQAMVVGAHMRFYDILIGRDPVFVQASEDAVKISPIVL